MNSNIVEKLKSTFDSIPSGLEAYLEGVPGGSVGHWHLFTNGQLEEPVSVNGVNFSRWNLAAGLAETLIASGVMETVGEVQSPESLMKMITIGTRDGDYLLVDGSKIYCFHHDGHELEVIAEDWSGFLELARPDDSSGTRPGELVGIWDPKSSETEPLDMFDIFCPVLHLGEDGVAIQDLGDEKIEGQWVVRGSQIRLTETRGVVCYEFTLSKIGLDIRSPTGGYHCHYEKRQMGICQQN